MLSIFQTSNPRVSFETLFDLICDNNLEEIKRLIEEKLLDIRQTYGGQNALDIASREKKIIIIEYLLNEYPELIKSNKDHFSFIYYLICPPESDDLAEEKEWFLNDFPKYLPKIKEHDPDLTDAHIDGLFGRPFENTNALYGGLLPIHYAALVANPHCLDTLAGILNTPLNNGFLKEITLGWILADNYQWELLKKLVTIEGSINLNQFISDPHLLDSGKSIAYYLRLAPDVFKDLVPFSEPVNLNIRVGNLNHSYYGVDLFWFLCCDEQWDLLEELMAASTPETILLDNGPQNPSHINYGWDCLRLLVFYGKFELINAHLSKFVPGSIDLDSTWAKYDENNTDYGCSTLWDLIYYDADSYLIEQLVCLHLKLCIYPKSSRSAAIVHHKPNAIV